MTGCIFKLSDGRCDKPGRYLSPCIGEACAHQTPTNGDRIRAMTDEELAEWILREPFAGFFSVCPPGTKDGEDCPTDPCEECWLDWLKSPVQPGEGEDG